MSKLDYVTACVNALDYFEESYSRNRGEFDRFTVVTTEADSETISFCEKNKIGFVCTDLFYLDGRKFDRGLALNMAWGKIKEDADWVCHLDCDTFVPKNWREKLPQLDREWFYGARRVLINTYQDYLDFLDGKKTEKDFEIPLGIGYGFFQMFNWNSSVIQKMVNLGRKIIYPGSPLGNACESDWMFRNMWGEHPPGDYTSTVGRLAELPFYVYHLGQHGQNHNGRVSPKFK